MEQTSKLKPCPFCGYEHPNIMFKNGYGAFVISCEQCGTVFHFQAGEREKIKDRLISAWNRRANDGL